MISTKQSSCNKDEILRFKNSEIYRTLRDLNQNFDDLELKEDEEVKFDFESEKGA